MGGGERGGADEADGGGGEKGRGILLLLCSHFLK